MLKVWLVDPGIVFQRFIIEARPIPQSYLGPPESYRGGGAATQAGRSGAPKR
jgi:hypothetical protein